MFNISRLGVLFFTTLFVSSIYGENNIRHGVEVYKPRQSTSVSRQSDKSVTSSDSSALDTNGRRVNPKLCLGSVYWKDINDTEQDLYFKSDIGKEYAFADGLSLEKLEKLEGDRLQLKECKLDSSGKIIFTGFINQTQVAKEKADAEAKKAAAEENARSEAAEAARELSNYKRNQDADRCLNQCGYNHQLCLNSCPNVGFTPCFDNCGSASRACSQACY